MQKFHEYIKCFNVIKRRNSLAYSTAKYQYSCITITVERVMVSKKLLLLERCHYTEQRIKPAYALLATIGHGQICCKSTNTPNSKFILKLLKGVLNAGNMKLFIQQVVISRLDYMLQYLDHQKYLNLYTYLNLLNKYFGSTL